jgi:hypothetical protein
LLQFISFCSLFAAWRRRLLCFFKRLVKEFPGYEVFFLLNAALISVLLVVVTLAERHNIFGVLDVLL